MNHGAGDFWVFNMLGRSVALVMLSTNSRSRLSLAGGLALLVVVLDSPGPCQKYLRDPEHAILYFRQELMAGFHYIVSFQRKVEGDSH